LKHARAGGSFAAMDATLRLARAADAAALAAIYRPRVEGSAISFELVAPDAAEMARRVAATLPVLPWLVCAGADDQAVGYAYAARHRDRAAYQWSVDVSVYVRDDRRRIGVGRALYGRLFEILRLQGFRAAHAGITLPNPGSVGLHEALGFRPIGVYRAVGYKFGAWHDVGWWQLDLRPPAPDPPPPRPLADVLADPGAKAALAATAPGGAPVLGDLAIELPPAPML
jgi:phosphinothricin acetyltransferase